MATQSPAACRPRRSAASAATAAAAAVALLIIMIAAACVVPAAASSSSKKRWPVAFQGYWKSRPNPSVITINPVEGTSGSVVQIIGAGNLESYGGQFGFVKLAFRNAVDGTWDVIEAAAGGKNYTGVLARNGSTFVQYPYRNTSAPPAFPSQWYKIRG